jgi:hypothetical protein
MRDKPTMIFSQRFCHSRSKREEREAAIEAMRKGWIVHGKSLTKFLILRNQLLSYDLLFRFYARRFSSDRPRSRVDKQGLNNRRERLSSRLARSGQGDHA